MPEDRKGASLDNYALEIQDISDSFPKSLAQYKIPFRDGSLIEDMGMDTRSITFRCFFYNDTYQTHFDFLKHIKEKKSLFDLIHPVYGLLKGSIQSVSVRHNEMIETAKIDITFLESITEPEPVRDADIKSSAEDIFENSIAEQKEKFSNDMRDALGSEAEGILSKTLDPDKGILEQFTGLSKTARGYVKTVDTYINKFESTLNDIANPANSLISAIDFGTNLPGRVIGAIASTAERYSLLYDSLKNSPIRFIQSFRNSMTELSSALGLDADSSDAASALQSQTSIATALQGSLDIAYIYSDDEDNRNKARSSEKIKSFDSSGKYVKTEAIPELLTVDEIEQSLSDVRTDLQASIDESRGMQSLKDMALALLNHAYTTKIESEKLIPVTIDNSTPLHLICLMYDLPYQYAERIHSVNNIKHPNFVKGDIKIYAR